MRLRSAGRSGCLEGRVGRRGWSRVMHRTRGGSIERSGKRYCEKGYSARCRTLKLFCYQLLVSVRVGAVSCTCSGMEVLVVSKDVLSSSRECSGNFSALQQTILAPRRSRRRILRVVHASQGGQLCQGRWSQRQGTLIAWSLGFRVEARMWFGPFAGTCGLLVGGVLSWRKV